MNDLEIIEELKTYEIELIEYERAKFDSHKCENGYVLENKKVVILSISDYNLTQKILTLIFQLIKLEELYLRRNKISTISENISQLKKLYRLHLGNNQISQIPESILALKKLEVLSMYSNNINVIPKNINKLKALKNLNLKNNNIGEIPTEVSYLRSLEQLLLQKNQIKDVNDNFSLLDNLKKLNLNDNKIKNISKGILGLRSLEILELNQNEITDFPGSYIELKELSRLTLSRNRIRKIPDSIAQLTNLTTLSINGNKLYKISNKITYLEQLTTLKITHNLFQEIPIEILNIKGLEHLFLNSNKIVKVSKNIIKLTKLKRLTLANNKIVSIDKNLLKLEKLIKINLNGNPLTIELKELKNLNAKELITYLLSIQDSSKPLNEAKILILGDEDVGKTSIVNRIVEDKFEKSKTMTEGINIQNYHLENDINVNIWDFAGQEITHQTHQFFLTTRSLYLLVLNAQIEDNDSAIYDWLEVIKSNGGNSPIVIVVNQIDKNKGYHFDRNRYTEDFHNIVDVIYTSALENINIDKLIQIIEKNVEEIEGVRAVFNKDWFEVKEVLENLSEDTDYIEIGEFDKICEKNNIDEELDQQSLLSLLHQIGTVVRYENKNLQSVQILNPIWVTNAVYKVIRSEFLNTDAILKREYLYEIFKGDNRYKQRHHQWIMDLLVQFEVAFRVNEDEILIPSRLHNNQPDFDLDKFKGLNLRYSYEGRLKKSIIAHFMVKMSRYLTNEKIPYWKNGVFLERSDCRAVVISNIDKREISIYIDTQNRQGREFLAIIRDKFDEVNINSIVVEEIPLIINNKIVGYEEYEYLVGLEQDGEIDVTLKTDTKKRRERFVISKLLDGYTKTDKNIFDYEKLRDDLIEISLSETKSRNTIYKESEDETNDRFEKALFNRNYNVSDQSRAGESSSGINAGERDLVIRNSKGIDESIIEALQIKEYNNGKIESWSQKLKIHYTKLVERYDTVGNRVNFLLVYSKVKNFDDLWKKYVDYDKFDNFVDTEDKYSQKDNVRVGVSEYGKMTIYHLFINFYSHGGD